MNNMVYKGWTLKNLTNKKIVVLGKIRKIPQKGKIGDFLKILFYFTFRMVPGSTTAQWAQKGQKPNFVFGLNGS